jgi:hypothetical protein
MSNNITSGSGGGGRDDGELVSVKKNDLIHLVASNIVLGVLSESIKIVNADNPSPDKNNNSGSSKNTAVYVSSRKFLNQQRWLS